MVRASLGLPWRGKQLFRAACDGGDGPQGRLFTFYDMNTISDIAFMHARVVVPRRISVYSVMRKVLIL